MNFDEFDRKMRVFETAQDVCVLPGIHMVGRLDGRGFTRLTKEAHPFEKPFDVRFRDLMIQTAEHLMTCGFRAIYAYTQSDEISVLFHVDEETFGRKIRKFDSILAGEASAKFSLLLGSIGTFDCRISQLPNTELVRDYFRWRQEDAHRNALNGHCYWALREHGQTVRDATEFLLRKSVAAKNELLFQNGVNFNDLPNWQKRGIGLEWETYEEPARNPLTGEAVISRRRRIRHVLDLPLREEYDKFILSIVRNSIDA